jgi:hypothetical protein
VAGHRILEEEVVELIDDGYEASALDDRCKVLIRFTDFFLGQPGALPDDLRDGMLGHFTEEEIVECSMYLAMASGLSKMLIAMGGEPQEMAVTVAPVEAFSAIAASSSTPGSPR